MKTRRTLLLESGFSFLAAAAKLRAQPPGNAAHDESRWRDIQQTFVEERDILNLNHAAVGCAPRPVLSAVEGYTREVERLPAYSIFRYAPRLEPIRASLATMFGCDAEEIAITRNATEALQVVLLGLPLKAGDEVVTTTLDYWAMLDALDQRQKRDGVVVKKVRVPVPPRSEEELVAAYEAALTERTKLILVSHPVNLTGQHFPVKKICQLAHSRGIEVVVDAAQSFGQFDISSESLQCDYLGTSLHKWLMAPKGTGLLYVKREKIPSLWPLFASGTTRKQDDIRKFEAFGTAPMTILAIADAIKFHQAIGTPQIAERLKYLTRLWADELSKDDRFEFRTSFEPGMSNGIATVHVKNIDSRMLQERLYQQNKIFTFNIGTRTKEFQGIRVSAGLATMPSELDRFVSVMKQIVS